MARYIDADKYVEYLEKEICSKCIDEVCGACGLDSARWIAEEFPTADVAPRAEVAREIIEDVATLIEAHWSEIQHGVYWLVCGRCTPLRELLKTVEKKYTEGEKNG